MDLNNYIKSQKISQQLFCKQIGVSQPTLSRYLNGVTEPTISIARLIEIVTEGKVSIKDWNFSSSQELLISEYEHYKNQRD